MWDWFEKYWSSVGLGAALVLIVLLLFTDVLRHRTDVSRWRDPVWLAWATCIAYLLHNFEEYGIDAMGRAFHFPITACDTYGFSDTASCPLTPAFFTAVNIPIVWLGLGLAALLTRRMPAVGLVGSGLLFTNALSHISALIKHYTPGTLTSIAIFIPLSLWIFATQFGRREDRLPYTSLVTIFVAAILAQGVLLGLLSALSSGAISESAAIAVQILDPVVLLGLPWLVQRMFPATAQPRTATNA